MAETINLRRDDDGIAVLTLNRPDHRNAVNGQMFAELDAALDELADGRTRAMVLTGAGTAFCGGADVHDDHFDRPSPAARSARVALGYQVAGKLHDTTYPTLCAVNGSCVALGVSFAALCDLRIAAASARFSFGFATVGMLPDLGASVMLPRLIGLARATELTLLDPRLGAVEMLELGLLNRVVDDAVLMVEAMAYASVLAARSPLAVQRGRRMMNDQAGSPVGEALAAEAVVVEQQLASEDLAEGIAAIREKRTPRFTGR